MAIYEDEYDGVKGWTNEIKEAAAQDPEKVRLILNDDDAFELWKTNLEERKKNTKAPTSLTEDMELLGAMSRRIKALSRLDKPTRAAREELAVNLCLAGEDVQTVYDICEIPNPKNFQSWLLNRGDVPEAIMKAAKNVKNKKAGVTS